MVHAMNIANGVVKTMFARSAGIICICTMVHALKGVQMGMEKSEETGFFLMDVWLGVGVKC